jgi:hypothetical protein
MRFDNLLEWFSGKSRETIVTFTIPALDDSAALGYWKKGVARKVRATLNKQNVAARWSREVMKELKIDYQHPLYKGLITMCYGSYSLAPSMLITEALNKLHAKPYFFTKKGTAQRTLPHGTGLLGWAIKHHTPLVIENVNEVIERWARANAEVSELVNLLDARRPKPVIVMKTLSPTVASNISAHLGIDVSTIQSPPMRGKWVEFEHKGKKELVYVVTIDWPEGTQHNKSRFVHSGNHQQCQACGHAIKDCFNWVPILAYGPSEKTTPCSLWVGRDCAAKLFGCEVEGDAVYPERQLLQRTL